MMRTVWRRDEGWVGSEIDGEFVMISVESGHYVSLNRTARWVWDELASPVSHAELERRLLASFDVAGDVGQRELTDLLAKMRDLGLAAEVAASGAG